jgi:hypothetical protein
VIFDALIALPPTRCRQVMLARRNECGPGGGSHSPRLARRARLCCKTNVRQAHGCNVGGQTPERRRLCHNRNETMKWGWPVLVGALLAAESAAAAAADTSAAPVMARTEDVELFARLIIDRQAVANAVGSDLKRQYAIVELTVVPRGGYPVTISREDFLLRSERDNEHSTADSPDRIAGDAVLVLGPDGRTQPARTVLSGGLPGIRLGGPERHKGKQEDSSTGANAAAAADPAKQTALLNTLKEKELPLGETRKPVKGYLYFPVDPQQKAKNFHLHYKGPNGSCELRFK